MKNKLIINIVLVYFVLLAIVLVVQMKLSSNNDISTEPLKDNVTYSDILSDGIVLYDRSPVMLVNQKQMLVNADNGAAVPTVTDDRVMVPVNFFENAYGAVVSTDKNKQTATIRLDNIALVIDGKNHTATLVSASEEKTLETDGEIELKNGTVYMPLECFAEGFDKELSIYNSTALLSDKEPQLAEDDVPGFIQAVEPQVNNLPSVDEQDKLEELLGSGAVNIFNTIGESIGFTKTDNPVSTLGLDTLSADEPSILKTDGEYLYFIRDNNLCVARAGEHPETISITNTGIDQVYGLYNSGKYVSIVGSTKIESDSSDDVYDGCIIAVYDTTDKTLPVLVRQIAAEGIYKQAHLKDNTVYLFVYKEADSSDGYSVPKYYDNANSSVSDTKSLSQVRYVPEMADKAYTSVLCFNISDMGRALNIHTLLGCGENYSLTGNSLYIAAPSQPGTSVYKLNLQDTNLSYASAAYVNGNIPDRGCINELNGVLRLASWTDDMANVTLLNDMMDVTDSLSDISTGGNIVNARFIGNRAYLVTDNSSSPVFALDLGDEISELGAIAIPENTAAVRNYDAEHFVCIKDDGNISMLNISDISNPYEEFSVQTGGKCLYNKVLLSTEAGVLAVPLEVTDTAASNIAENTTVTETAPDTTTEITSISEATTEAVTTQQNTLSESGSYVRVYSPDIQSHGFIHINTVNLEGDEPSDMLYYGNRLYIVTENKIVSTYIE